MSGSKMISITGFAVLGLGVQLTTGACSGDYDEYKSADFTAQVGQRPLFLVDQLEDGELKDALRGCKKAVFNKTPFSIGHRGAAMQFPEHTLESYVAAARQGAGIIECDVTFTRDAELVCRHSQCDLHTTTNILATDLHEKCTQDFVPATFDTDGNLVTPASAECCTSDITLAELRTLRGKMDGENPNARTVDEYLRGTPTWRTDLYAGTTSGTLMTHAESVALFKTLRVGVTPELKEPSVSMPFDTDGDGVPDYSYEDYRRQLIDELRAGGIHPRDAFVQSFVRDDIDYWIANTPDFGAQAVYLDDANDPTELPSAADLQAYKAAGIDFVAPPLWALVTASGNDILPSQYALDAKAADLEIITWSLERSGSVADGNAGWYYQTILGALSNEGDILRLLDVLARDVGVKAIFSDWPATVTYYVNCMAPRFGLEGISTP
jgi:glycerophosphoryl diester phosphodiesterase